MDKKDEKFSLNELLENGYDAEVEVEETRENLGWGLIAKTFVIITG